MKMYLFGNIDGNIYLIEISFLRFDFKRLKTIVINCWCCYSSAGIFAGFQYLYVFAGWSAALPASSPFGLGWQTIEPSTATDVWFGEFPRMLN